MKREVGLWIDHTKAIIVTVMEEKEETRQVRSNIEKRINFMGDSHGKPLYGTRTKSLEDNLDPKMVNFLTSYYDGVVSLIRNADSIWIFGPGNAKKELEKHLQRDQLNSHIVGIESVVNMTDRQITEKVRQHYQK